MSRPYQHKDTFYRKAQAQNLRARSAFKLEEIQERWRLAREGDAVVDLGASPGGFLQILIPIVGPRGRLVGVDLEAIRPLGPTVETFQGDVFDPGLIDRLRQALGRPTANVVASDLAPKTSGIREADEARSLALSRRALEVAQTLLAPGGHFVVKVFMGGEFDELLKDVRPLFEDVRVLRPEASRSRSRECYIVAQRRKISRPGPTVP